MATELQLNTYLWKTGFLTFFVSNGTTPKRKHEKIVAALLLIQLLRARQSFSRDAFSSFFYKKFDNLEGPKFLGILYIKIDIWCIVILSTYDMFLGLVMCHSDHNTYNIHKCKMCKGNFDVSFSIQRQYKLGINRPLALPKLADLSFLVLAFYCQNVCQNADPTSPKTKCQLNFSLLF